MKLKDGFITYKTGKNYVAVSSDEAEPVLNGMVRSNETANFILRQLKEDTTEEQIVAAMLKEYDVTEDVASQDVRRIVNLFRDEGLLE